MKERQRSENRSISITQCCADRDQRRTSLFCHANLDCERRRRLKQAPPGDRSPCGEASGVTRTRMAFAPPPSTRRRCNPTLSSANGCGGRKALRSDDRDRRKRAISGFLGSRAVGAIGMCQQNRRYVPRLRHPIFVHQRTTGGELNAGCRYGLDIANAGILRAAIRSGTRPPG
jgi:hypothetical protein